MRPGAFALVSGLCLGLLQAPTGMASPKHSAPHGPQTKGSPPKVPALPPADGVRTTPPPIPGVPAMKGGSADPSGKKKGEKVEELKRIPGTEPPRTIELKEELIELDPLFEWRPIIDRMPTPRKFDPKTGKIVRVDKRLDMWGQRKRVSKSLEGAGDDDKERARRMRYWANEYEKQVQDIKKHGRREDKVVGVDTMEESAKKLRQAADRLDPPPKPKPTPKPAGKK